jgi:hypothetical protein
MPGEWTVQAGPFRQQTDAEGYMEFDGHGTISLDLRLDGWYVLEYHAPEAAGHGEYVPPTAA